MGWVKEDRGSTRADMGRRHRPCAGMANENIVNIMRGFFISIATNRNFHALFIINSNLR